LLPEHNFFPMTSSTDLTPQERLEISRRAIIRHMHHEEDHASEGASENIGPGDGAPHYQPESKWSAFSRAARSWWYHHPANVALDLAKPLLGKYTKEYPFRVLGIAAGIGAAAVLLKPWRLVSLGGLVLAAMKSSDIKGVILSVLTPSSTNPDSLREAE
jgi:hypothetical protein